EATERFEGGREKAASWLRWDPECTIFTRNATEAINTVAYTWGRANLAPGDRIVLTEMEHHSNLVPWQVLAEEKGANLEWVPIDDEGILDLTVLDGFLQGGDVKLVAVGLEDIRAHERDLVAYALERLAEVPGITIHGPRDADRRGAVISFALDHAHPHDVAEILGREGVCIRAGHHCAQVLMARLGVG